MGMCRRRWRLSLGRRRRGTGGRASRGLFRSSTYTRVSLPSQTLRNEVVVCLRGEDDSLTNKLALWIFGDSYGVATGAGCAADEVALGSGGPASMADVRELDFACIGVCSGASEHPEAFLERRCLAAGDVVDIETAIVDELSLRSSIADLGNATLWYISGGELIVARTLTCSCRSSP